MSDIAKKGAVIGTAVLAGCGVAVGGLLSMANSTSETAAGWLELSQRTDIGIESLQRWGYAAGQSGADIGKLEVGMKKLSDTMIDAQNGSKISAEAYENLGISMDELSSMTPEQAFERVMNSLADMEEGALKNSIGNDLLGKSYTELKPLLSEGSEGMQALKDKADELGIVMSEDSVVAAEGYGDSIDNIKLAFDGVKNNLMTALMPKLTELADWFVASMPTIQDFVTNALDKVSAGVQWVTDNSNILIPILAGVLGGFVALQVISGISALMTAWSTVTAGATTVQAALNAVMSANPIAIVVLAIAGLIAAGVLLYKNWDVVKTKVTELWEKIKTTFEGIKTAITEKVNAIKTKVTEVFNGIKTGVTEKVSAIKTSISDTFGAARDKAVEIFENIKSKITEKVNGVKTSITTVFSTVKDIMSKPFELARDTISGVIDKVKGFLNFNWEFPKLKMPHFKVSGSMNPMDWVSQGVPKLSVDWYAKGGIFSKPTIFNTPYGLKGVGDAKSPEIVAPLSNLNSIIRGELVDVMRPYLLALTDRKEVAPIIENSLYIDSEKLYTLIQKGKQKADRRFQTTATL